MSDSQQGPDWWLGTDGKWYPPVAAAQPPLDDLAVEIAEQTKRTNRGTWIIAIATLVVVVIAAGVVAAITLGGSDDPKVFLTGTFALTDASEISHPLADQGACWGTGGYDDIENGLRVVVTDGSGETLATGQLANATYVQNETYPILGECRFDIEMGTPLPNADFYTVSVGRRGETTYSHEELADEGWNVAYTLG
jgi:predicted porin